MRQRFEENRKETDMAKAAQILADGELELFRTQHYQPIKSKFDGAYYVLVFLIKHLGGFYSF